MQKSVNKLMYCPLRDDIPNGNLLKSKARPMTNAPSLRGLTMFTVTTHRSRGIWRQTTAKTFEEAKTLAFELQNSALDSEAYTLVQHFVPSSLTEDGIVFAVDRTGEVKKYTNEPKDDDVLVLSGKMVTIDISKDSD